MSQRFLYKAIFILKFRLIRSTGNAPGRFLVHRKRGSLAQCQEKLLTPQHTPNDTGICSFNLSEHDFDYDFPSDYCRQIRSISISFLALLGPYQSIHATLSQTANKTLLQADEEWFKYLLRVSNNQTDNSVLRVDIRANQQVSLSEGLNDRGLFILNFEDPHYLPFEEMRDVSSWLLEISKPYNPIL